MVRPGAEAEGLVDRLRSPWHHADCRAAADEIERLRGTVAEYEAWIRFHAAGNGDFHDFIRKVVAESAAEVTGKTVELGLVVEGDER